MLGGSGAGACRPFTFLKSAVKMLDRGGGVEIPGEEPDVEVVDLREVELLVVVVVVAVVDELVALSPAATSL